MMELPKLLCAKEVAEILGVTPRTAAKLMSAGAITAFKLSDAQWRTSGRYVGEYMLRGFERADNARERAGSGRKDAA